MMHIRSHLLPLLVATACILGLPPAGQAQDALPNQNTEQGKESGNWGLAPFIPIPILALSAEAKQTVRDLEDSQLRERRALEDKFQDELRGLLKRQAEEREALILRLTRP